MIRPAPRRATYQDVLDAPEPFVAELIAGELSLQPRPALRHAQAASVLGMLIGPPFHLGKGGPGGWIIQDEPELHLGEHVLVPDLAGWRRAEHPDLDLALAFASIAPDWVCEVLSPSTQGTDRVKKLPIYGDRGVKHAWMLDPLSRTLEVFKHRDGAWTLLSAHAGDEAIRAEPFEAIAIQLSDLWS